MAWPPFCLIKIGLVGAVVSPVVGDVVGTLAVADTVALCGSVLAYTDEGNIVAKINTGMAIKW